MEKEKTISKELAETIYDDLRVYYIGKRYSYEQIFIDSGDYDSIDKAVLYEFVSPLMKFIDTAGIVGFNEYIKYLES